MMRCIRVAIVAAGFIHVAAADAADHALYAIGNSLTLSILPYSIPDFANQRAKTFDVGFYTPSGRALDYIVANPALENTGSPAALDQAFQGYTWTDISMEPYPSATSTLASDIASIQAIVNSARAGTSSSAHLYVYSAWPSQTSFAASGFAAYWRASVPDDLSQPTMLNRAYADHLYARLATLFGATTSVSVIPVGDVLAALDDMIRAGQVAGITDISQLYADNDHLGDVGKFIAAVTVYATLFKDNPEGLAIPAGYIQGNAPAAPLTDALAAQLETLVWHVVNSDSRTGANSAPVAAAQSLTANSTRRLSITLHATDAENSNLSYAVVTEPGHGQLSGEPPALSYLPDAGYSGPDSFSFKANDGALDSAPARISIAVEQFHNPLGTAGGGGGGALGGWSLLGLSGLLGSAVMRRRSNRSRAVAQPHRKMDATQRN